MILGLEQRLHPAIRIGLTVTTMSKRGTELPLHCRQGTWDGACGLYCVAMALVLLGRLKSTFRIPDRRNSVAGAFWRAGREKYFEGLDGRELADMVRSLDPTLLLRTARRSHDALARLTTTELAVGRLVILAWTSRSGDLAHWVLVVGIEGRRLRERFRPTTLLCLDPSDPEPVLCGYNGRLELANCSRAGEEPYVRYLSHQNGATLVQLTEAVVIGESG